MPAGGGTRAAALRDATRSGRWLPRWRIGPVAVLAASALLLACAALAQATVEKHGYLKARDGTRLRYDVVRPDGRGPFPTLVNYEGYAAGSDAADNGVGTYIDRLLARGYAVVGVSVRGTGCSEGEFDPFAHTMGTDGYDAVEWAARQPWSDGRVGMIGVSFGGITQLLTAAERPPHLLAIAPSSATSDLYRDVVYPGGILEYDFTFAWTGVQKESGTEYALTGAPLDGDAQCEQNFASHEVANSDQSNFIPALVLQHPYFDDSPKWARRAPNAGFSAIDVPVYMFNQWQDEQLPGRIWESLGMFSHPNEVWANYSNGNHARDYYSAADQRMTLDFLDHFVRGVNTGFQRDVSHLSVGLETKIAAHGDANVPSWSIDRDSLHLRTVPRSFYLRSGGRMTPARPKAGEDGDSYSYPAPAPDVIEPGPDAGGAQAGQLAWKAPVPPGGSVAYTSPPFSKDMVVAGPASVDLWLSSTATDTDLQATVTEVRPDGQETYVQRGWLRASHRRLDPKLSTALRPYQTHFRRDAKPLVPGKPAHMRFEVFPFAHAFREGSRLRIWIEAPTGHTGFWAFQPVPDPAVNTVLHDPDHPSRLVVGTVPGAVAQAPLPACDTLRNQPCRSDPVASSG
jgi:putative CocE/NonD family hydrolase